MSTVKSPDYRIIQAVHDVEYVRMETAHCLVRGLFRSLQRGERKRAKTDILYRFNKAETLRFIGFEPLGADDLRVFQGIVAFAGLEGASVGAEPEGKREAELRRQLNIDARERESEPEGRDKRLECPDVTAAQIRRIVAKWPNPIPAGAILAVAIPFSRFLREVGLAHSGENIATVKSCLTRMANISAVFTRRVIVGGRSREQMLATQLIASMWDGVTGRMCVAINPRLAAAVLGELPYREIDMNEVRAIKSEPLRIVHAWLCGWIDPAKPRKVTIDKLCSIVWPSAASDDAWRQRRKTMREALGELQSIGWLIGEYARGKYEIQRPRRQLALPFKAAP